MKEFNTSFNFAVDDGAFSTYLNSAPYPISGFKIRGDNITVIPTNDMLLQEYDDLKLYVNRYSETDQMTLLAPIMTKEKLLGITNYYTNAAADFATENSVMMTTLGYTTEQKIAFVNKAVAELEPIKKHIEMFSYYVIWDMFDNIVRDEILTEERINSMKNDIYNVIFGE